MVFDFESGLYTLCGISFNISLCYFIYEELIKKLPKKKSFVIIVFVFILLMISGLYSSIILFYPMSNSIAIISVFLAIFFMYKAKKNNEKLLYISMIFMITFIWSRTESIIVSVILMFFMTNMDFKKDKVIKYLLICTLAVLLWYIKFFTLAGLNFNSGKFLTISKSQDDCICINCIYNVYNIYI